MSNMLSYTNYIEKIYIPTFNTANVTNMSYMFYLNAKLKNIYVGDGWNTDNVTSSSYMFLSTPNIQNFNSSSTDKTNAHYGEGGYLTYYLTSASVGGVSYSYEHGMTWEEWINSDYNTFGFFIDGNFIYKDSLSYYVANNDGTNVRDVDRMDPIVEYQLVYDSTAPV